MSLLEEIKAIFGTDDVMSLEFKKIDDNTSRKKLNFKRLRGNIRLIMGKVKLPKDLYKEIDEFLSLEIP